MRITVISCYGTLDISASSKNGTHLGIFSTRHMIYNFSSLHYTYSERVIDINDSLEQSNSSPNSLIFM